jgi:alpha-1,2-mannosyltransferase
VAQAAYRGSRGGYVAAARRFGEVGLFAFAPVLLTVAILVGAVGERYAFDFHGGLWQATVDILHGRNPYPPPTVAGVTPGNPFVYPPAVAVLLLPLGVLPFPVAAAVVTVLLLACIAGTLWVLGVRDWRCYGVAYLSIAVIHGVRLGALTPALAFGLALTWRWRARARAAVPLALIVIAKIFLWPVGVWLLATGRLRLAFRTAAIALGATVISWAAIGFAGLVDYPKLIKVLSDVYQGRGYSLVAAGLWLGLTPTAARVFALAVGVAVLALCWREGRRGRDERSFTLALAAAFALSPIVWLHYFVLLLVPIAIVRQTFSPLWLAPTLFWATPYEEHFDQHWRIAAGLAIACLALTGSLLAVGDVEAMAEVSEPA